MAETNESLSRIHAKNVTNTYHVRFIARAEASPIPCAFENCGTDRHEFSTGKRRMLQIRVSASGYM